MARAREWESIQFKNVRAASPCFVCSEFLYSHHVVVIFDTQAKGACAKYRTHRLLRLLHSVCLSNAIWYSVSDSSVHCTMYVFLFCYACAHPVLWHYSCRTGYLVWLVRVCKCTSVYMHACLRTLFFFVWVLSHLFWSWKQVFYETHYIRSVRICRLLQF